MVYSAIIVPSKVYESLGHRGPVWSVPERATVRRTTYGSGNPWIRHGTWKSEKRLKGYEGRTYGANSPVAIVIHRLAK